jgi:hypothetical protein
MITLYLDGTTEKQEVMDVIRQSAEQKELTVTVILRND